VVNIPSTSIEFNAGVYAQYQPEYARHGIPTFPVNISIDQATGKVNKQPAVPRYLKRKFERWWVDKCGDCNGIGFANGLARLFVADLDSTNPDIIREGFKLFGESPVVWQTGSGKFAVPYLAINQRRRIRPIPSLPIDMLGEGGFTAAPPSVGGHVPYQFIHGCLADFERLPSPRIPQEMQVNDEPEIAATPEPGRVAEGGRHEWLKAALMQEVWLHDNKEGLLDKAMTLTNTLDPGAHPVTRQEVESLVDWYWRHREDGTLWRPGYRHWNHEAVDLGLIDPRACVLYLKLRVVHPGSAPFVVANGMHKSMRMNETLFAAKRKLLVDMGLLKLLRPPTGTSPALYCWPKARVEVLGYQ
jgi:hypothetical protein